MRTTARAFLLTAFLAPLLTSAQPAIQWQKCLGGSSYDIADAVHQTSDGGYIVAGSTESTNGDVSGFHGGPYSDAWVVKLSATGTIQWQKCLGGTESDEANSIQPTADGGYVVAGSTRSNNGDVSGWHTGYNNFGNPTSDAWVVKLDAMGAVQWQKCLGGTGSDAADFIEQTTDGGYVVAGHTQSNDGDVSGLQGAYDGWVVKLSATGSIQWSKCVGGSQGDHFGAVHQTTDGGYVVAGHTQSNDGDVSGLHGTTYDAWVVKLSGTGNIQWIKVIGGTSWDQARSIQQTNDGGYVVAGYTRSNDGDVSGNHGSDDAWVLKLDANGNIQWQKCFGGSQAEALYSIRQTTDGGYVATGNAKSHDGDVIGVHTQFSLDAWVIRLDNAGDLQWQKCLGGSSGAGAFSIQQATDGGYVVAASTSSNDGDVSGNHGGLDAWVVKLGPAEVGMAEEEAERFTLAPNPTRGNVHIGFASGAKPRSVVLLDAMGRTVLVQPIANTSGTTALDLGGHENGLYFVQVRFADGTRAVERVVKE